MRAEQVIPVLRIFDYNKTIEFYIDWLGFEIGNIVSKKIPLFI
nr:glyoxalase superfamily protein [Chryseobacterium sp. LAM-KRS1]